MTDELDRQVRSALQRRRPLRIIPVVMIALAIAAAAGSFLWITYGDQFRLAVFATPRAAGSPETGHGEEPISRSDFEAFERQTAASVQKVTENLDAAKVDLQKLSAQVSDLAAKVDAMRNAVEVTPATPQVQNSNPAQPVVPPRPAATAQRKPPRGPKPAGPISVGGAPLPPPLPR